MFAQVYGCGDRLPEIGPGPAAGRAGGGPRPAGGHNQEAEGDGRGHLQGGHAAERSDRRDRRPRGECQPAPVDNQQQYRGGHEDTTEPVAIGSSAALQHSRDDPPLRAHDGDAVHAQVTSYITII